MKIPLNSHAVLNERQRTVDVGWLLKTDHAQFVWQAPRLLRQAPPRPTHPKSLAVCPAVIDHDSRIFEVLCPIDIELRIKDLDKDQILVEDVAGERASVAAHIARQLISVNPRAHWRHPKRPLLQIKTPYVFVSDDEVILTQTPPYHDYKATSWPGAVVAGRVPIRVWPRPLTWAFEWWETERNLCLRRGEPWFYVWLSPPLVRQTVRLVEAKLTPDLSNYLAGINGVVNYVTGTYSLLSTADERRPSRLLVRAR